MGMKKKDSIISPEMKGRADKQENIMVNKVKEFFNKADVRQVIADLRDQEQVVETKLSQDFKNFLKNKGQVFDAETKDAWYEMFLDRHGV